MDRSEFLSKSPFFSSASKATQKAIADASRELSLPKGDYLFRAGEPADAVFLILSGGVKLEVATETGTRVIGHPGEGRTVGVVPLLGESTRFASAIATSDSRILKIDSKVLETLTDSLGDDMTPVLQALSERLMRRHTGVVLRHSEKFGNLPENILTDLEKRVEMVNVASGETVCAAGDPSDSLYIVVTGRLRIWIPEKGSGGTFLNEVGAGASIGEMGVITGNPRAADVLAVRDTTLARLPAKDLHELLGRYPEEINKLFVGIIVGHFMRQAPGGGKAQNTAGTFALIPIRGGMPMREIATHLSAALSSHGKTIVMDSAYCDNLLGKPGISQLPFNDTRNGAFLGWLNEQELGTDFAIYLADSDTGNWTQRCLRQADHVLFVGHGKDSPEIGEIEAKLLETPLRGVRKTLLLVHDPDTSVPKGTLAWLQARAVGLHHHVHLGREEDYARLARFLTGRAVSLVFGGGGARGFAHVGVIRALRQHGIPIDLVGGTSMGALIGSQVAMQHDPGQILKETVDLCLAGDEMTVPMVSLFSGKKFSSGVRRICGDHTVEDLWHRYYSVSCNISRARVRVHDRGPLYRAVLASNTPPALFPPFIEDGDLHVDGALLNNLPVDIMLRYNEGGKIIAVDVDPQNDMTANEPYDGGLSGWQVLRSKLNPFSQTMNVPGIMSIVARATAIGGIAQYKQSMSGLADLYLSPPTGDFAIMAYKDGPKIADMAYDYAMKAIDDWRKGNETGQAPSAS
ncbi:cyclic nucleotide-binding and patatin-like phospholipase domain-containing protein [Magnetospira thiophila]